MNYTGANQRFAIKPVAVGRVPLFEQAEEKPFRHGSASIVCMS